MRLDLRNAQSVQTLAQYEKMAQEPGFAERAQEVMDAMEQNGFEVVYTENRKDWMVIVSKYRG